MTTEEIKSTILDITNITKLDRVELLNLQEMLVAADRILREKDAITKRVSLRVGDRVKVMGHGTMIIEKINKVKCRCKDSSDEIWNVPFTLINKL